MDHEAVLQECRERQEDEIVALESIFAPTEDDDSSKQGVNIEPSQPRVTVVQKDPQPIIELCLPITLPGPTRIAVDTYAPASSGTEVGAVPSKAATSKLSAGEDQSTSTTRNGPDAVAHSTGKPRNGKHRKSKSGNLNAAAAAFQPGTSSTSQPSASHADQASELPISPRTRDKVGQVADALSEVRIGSDPVGQDGRKANGSLWPPQPQSSQLLPPLTHLAPINIRVRLPPLYLAEKPPIVESLTASWLPARPYRNNAARAWLLQKLDEQCQEVSGMEMLYIWATYLSEGLWAEILETGRSDDSTSPPPFLHHITSDSGVGESRLRFEEHLETSDDQPVLAAQLLAHSRLCSRSTFDASTFDCAICLETRKGRACTRLTGCGHVFCSECLAGYLASLVDDGFHRQAKRCPDPECVALWSQREKQNLVDQEGNLIIRPQTKGQKAAATPDASADVDVVVGLVTRPELEVILGPTRLARLDELTVKAKVEADPSVSYCPRSGCQAPVVRLSSDENSGHWERFRECLSCGFAFCAWCSRSWHGSTSCPVSFQSSLIRQYLSLPESSAERRVMEQKFGRKTLETMVRKYQEEQETQQYLKEHTTPCPTCSISIEKSYGCNHMTCKQCATHYCYLCGKAISSQNPYMHFNSPGYECYQRLFDGLLGDQGQRRGQEGEEQDERAARAGEGGNGDGRPGFALLLDENGIPLHLEPEDEEADFLAWQQFH